ncbi:helix-turn-helix domain-containing protein [Mediterraneibacter faecis]|uniref:helix-turn-helix domain-containing protein n=1 Tax=Mediterraneibacter faecis TaxID=592978 RepID=UPI0022E4BF66|nr:helix-turn-helix domain-containing protein [Mediterraneibacter faecis]
MEYKTDSLLVHLARAGDEDACEKLVKKYYSSIYQYCLRSQFVTANISSKSR